MYNRNSSRNHCAAHQTSKHNDSVGCALRNVIVVGSVLTFTPMKPSLQDHTFTGNCLTSSWFTGSSWYLCTLHVTHLTLYCKYTGFNFKSSMHPFDGIWDLLTLIDSTWFARTFSSQYILNIYTVYLAHRTIQECMYKTSSCPHAIFLITY